MSLIEKSLYKKDKETSVEPDPIPLTLKLVLRAKHNTNKHDILHLLVITTYITHWQV